MPNWFEKLVLSEQKLNLLKTIEMYDVHRQQGVYPSETVLYTAYSENDDSRIVKVKQTFDNKRPVDLIVWGMVRDAKSGEKNSLNEANSWFARLAYKKIYKKYINQRQGCVDVRFCVVYALWQKIDARNCKV